MKRLTTIFLLLALAFHASAGDIQRISIRYTYVSDNPNESPLEAEKTALQRAKLKAMEEHFGLDVTSANNMILRNRAENGETTSSTDVYSLRETSVRGEWIETIQEEVRKKEFVKGFWNVEVYVEGRARNHSTPKTQIHYALINNTHDRVNRDQYYDGDDIFLRFSTPVSGSLCVYLVDENNDVFCLLPYQSAAIGCQLVEANTDYLFFSTQTNRMADEYTLNCQKSTEQNAVYIIFTPHTLTKALDKKGEKNWRDEQMPRQLTYKDFMSWLSKNQTRDEDMVVQTEVITIRK